MSLKKSKKMLVISLTVLSLTTLSSSVLAAPVNNKTNFINVNNEKIMEIEQQDDFDKMYNNFNMYLDKKMVEDKELSNNRLDYAEKYAEEFVKNYYSKSKHRAKRDIDVKDALRTDWVAGALILKVAGLNHTARLLKHSLDDSPSNMYLSSNDSLTKDIKNSIEFKNKLSEFKSKCGSKSSFQWNTSIALENSKDLYLALHRADITFYGKRVGGKLNISAKFHDKYNFEPWKYKGNVPHKFVVLVNNSAEISQQLGVISPYEVYVTID